MKKIVTIIILLSILILTSCSSISNNSGTDESKLNVVFVASLNTSESDINAQVKDELKVLQKSAGITYSVVEAADKESYSTYIKNLAGEKKYDLILTCGYSTSRALDSVAKDFPQQLFATIDYISNSSNVMSIAFKEEESAFYSGVMAALMTQTNTVGIIASFKNQNEDYIYGFMTGVKAVNEGINTVIEYTDSYTDLEAGTTAVQKIKAQGADIIYSAAAAPTSSIILFAEKNNMKVINSDIYVYSQQSDALISETSKKYKSSVDYIINASIEMKNNTNTKSSSDNISTELQYVGIAQEAFDFSISKSVPNDIKDKLKAVDIMLIDSDFIVPVNQSMYDNFDFTIFAGKAFKK
ncbi:MAG: BMP family ABC transporter substrate-binding protein [Eubacteriaceae bacterium]|nr:BMP family ABC transporter substrate-binding protein [Eubacteriaceae bacterium]